MNADRIIGQIGKLSSLNIFTYCINDPIDNYDPSGEYTLAYGIDAEVAFLIKSGLNTMLVKDDKDSVGILVGGSIGGGTPSASIGAIMVVTNADTIYDLEGIGLTTGGSYIAGVDAIVGSARNGATVVEAQFSVGVSTPIPEGHGQLSFSKVYSLDWLPSSTKNNIRKKLDTAFNSLPQDVIDEIDESIFFKIGHPQTTVRHGGGAGAGRSF